MWKIEISGNGNFSLVIRFSSRKKFKKDRGPREDFAEKINALLFVRVRE